MRIKLLKPVPGEGGKTHQPGEYLTVDDTAAKTYLSLAYAEEAPELDDDPVAQLKGLVGDIAKAVREEIRAESKGLNVGPRIDPLDDPSNPDSRPHPDDKPDVRQLKFGRWLQNVGVIESRETSNTAKADAAKRLAEVYKSAWASWADKPVIKAANVESSGPAGGYTVPPEFSTDIWRIAVEDTVLASRARKRPMTSNEFRYPKLDQTGTQATGQTGYLGGVVARWSREAATRPETEPKLKQGVMKAGELTGYSIISNELLQDNAAGLAALISELFAEAIAYYTDYATLVGDGVDKPMGVLNAGALVTLSSRATASHFNYADAVGMKAKLFPESMKRAFWVLNQTAMVDFYQFADGSSRNIILPYFPGQTAGPASNNPSDTLLSLPVVYTEKTPALGTKGDVLLIDPMGYMVGERMGLEIAASPHVNFLSNEMTYRFVARVAGQPLLDKSFTMLDGTNKLSHFIALP